MNHCEPCSMAKLRPLCATQAQGFPGEGVFSFSCCSCLLWPCLEEERGRIELPMLVYIEKGSTKSKYRGRPKLTSKTAEVTGYSEQRIVAEKSEISGAVFASPPKQCKRKNIILDDFNTEVLRRLVNDFYREKNALWTSHGVV